MRRLELQVKPLIWVEAQVERHSMSRIGIMVKAKSQFKERRYKPHNFVFLLAWQFEIHGFQICQMTWVFLQHRDKC